jgi:sodium transport system permease protein
MNRQAITIFKKEIRDMIRDRRMLVAAFSFALLGPVFMGIVFLLSKDDATDLAAAKLAVQHIDEAPGLSAFLEKQGVTLVAYEGDDTPGVIPAGADAVLMVPENYADMLQAGRVISLSLFIDEGSKRGIRKSNEIRRKIEAYGGFVAGMRLTARGMPPAVVTPLTVASYDVAEEGFLAQTMTGMFLMMILIAPFVGGISVAVDTLAGERERHSMQPLLAQPVTGRDVILGKLGMVSAFSIVGTLLALATFFAAVTFIPPGTLPFALHLDFATIPLVLLQLLPFAVLIAATQLFISIQVKSYKEGQSYISMFMMLPMFMAYLKIFGADKLPEGAFYLPILAEMQNLSSLIFNGEMAVSHFASSMAVAVLGTITLVFFTARKLESEVMLDAA